MTTTTSLLRTFGRETRATLPLAVPIMAGQLVQMLMGLADAVMVGRLGVVPLAAAAFANGLVAVCLVPGFGLLTAVPVLGAHAHGAGRPREAAEVLRHGLVLAVVAGGALAWLVHLSPWWLAAFRQPPEVVRTAVPFLRLLGWSLVPAFLWQCLRQFAEALSRPLVPMVTAVAALGLNVALNWVLIYGHWGAPRLGLAGAGWATLTARTAVVLTLAGWLAWSPRFHPLWRGWRWRAPLSGARLRAMLGIGLPGAFALLTEVGAFAAAAVMMGWLGPAALAAHQIALTCAATAFMFPLGLAQAVSIRISQALGSGHRERLAAIGHANFALTGLLMGAFAAVFLAAGRPVAGLFVRDAGVARTAAQLLAIAGCFQLFDGLQVVAGSALRGLADVRVPSLFALAAYWGVALPTSFLLGFPGGWREHGVWWGLAAGLALAAVLVVARFDRLTRGVPGSLSPGAGKSGPAGGPPRRDQAAPLGVGAGDR